MQGDVAGNGGCFVKFGLTGGNVCTAVYVAYENGILSLQDVGGNGTTYVVELNFACVKILGEINVNVAFVTAGCFLLGGNNSESFILHGYLRDFFDIV